MAPDDRERAFEKALARHLHPDAPEKADALHPDAEVLAAYHERLLAPAQMIFWKEHIASCARCQEILAHLEATDELLADVSQEVREERYILTKPEPEFPELAHIAARAPMPAEPQTAAASRWSRRLKALPGANWRWLAPAGALAAGLLLWVSFREANPPKFELAKNQPPTAPSPAPATLPQLAVPPDKEAASSAAPSSYAEPRTDASRESGGLAQNEGIARERKKLAPAQAGVQADALTGVPRVVPSPRELARADRGGRPSGVTGGVATAESGLQKQAPPSAVVPVPPPDINDQAAENRIILSEETKPQPASKAKSVASGRQTPQKEEQTTAVVAELNGNSAMRLAKAINSVTVTAPGSAVLWRVASAGLIERSTDAGSKWRLQASGVVTDLLAGSAPSDRVCWVVGRSGTILRTTDGGKHWQQIGAPVADDLVAVFAVDAQQATVSLAQGSYQTTDGGRTWNKLLAE